MAILVNPATGQKFEGPDENVAAAKRDSGLVTEQEYAAQQLQEEHGGEKLETALGSAQEQAAKRLSQVSQFAGDVDAMGNPVETVAPIPIETVAATVPGLAGANAPELAARQAANPISAGLGKAAADLPLYAGAGALTGGLGTGVASALGAGETLTGLAGAATANVALGAGQEAEAAQEEHRPIDVENIGKNIAFGALLEGAGYGVAKGLGAVFGEAKPLQAAVQSTLDRAGVAADDLGNPEVLSHARAQTQAQIEEAASKLEEAAASVRPVVMNNPVAQRYALRDVAEAVPELSDELQAAAVKPRAQRFQAIVDLRDQADSPAAQEALGKLAGDRSLWGDAAVDHADTMQALGAARAAGPEALADAARGIKDSTVERLVGELDSHFEDLHRFTAAEAFQPSVEAQGATAGAADANFNASDYDKALSEVLSNDKTALQVAGESDALLKDASQNTARSIDTVNDALKNELGVGEKYHAWEAESKKWSARKIAAQTSWLEDRVAQGKDVAETISNMKAAGYDGKSYAARIVDTIGQTEKRLASAETPLARAQVAENAKRAYDRLIMGLGKLPETALEAPVKQGLVDALRPLADDLRSGFEDASLFGSKIARYQTAANAAWHKLIEPLSAVNQQLTERLPPVFGEVGPNARGNVALQSKIEGQLRSYLGGGERAQNQLAAALEGVQELVSAKRAAGATPAQLTRLREIESAIQSMHDDQQLASVVRTAMKTAVEKGHGQFAGASPAATLGVGVAGHALDAAALHTLGLPVGRFVRSLEPAAARALTSAAKGARKALGIAEKAPVFGEEGSAVRGVLQNHAHRYARTLSDLHGNSSYAAETFGNQAPAYTGLLRKQGANLALRGPEGFSGAPPSGPGPGAAGANPMRTPVQSRVVGGLGGEAANEQAAAARQAGFSEVAPLAGAAGAGLAGLGAYKAFQGSDDNHAQYLQSAGARDTAATARALTDPTVAEDFARRSRGQPSTLELFQGDHATLQQAFAAQRSIVEQSLRDPDALVDRLSGAFGGLSPELRDKLSAKALQIATYLQGELPPQRGVSVTRPQGLPPAPLEARSYALKFMTATQPSTAFDDAKRGQLRHEQVDTLQAVWPAQYAELRAQTLTAMGNAKSSIQQRQRADLLFNFQTALDPAFSPRISAAAAAARQAQPQSQGSPSSAPSKSRVTPNLQPDGLAALAH